MHLLIYYLVSASECMCVSECMRGRGRGRGRGEGGGGGGGEGGGERGRGGDVTNRAAWVKKVNSYTGNPR